VVKVTTNSRRAFSVPAADVSYLPASRQSASTVDYTKDDISSLSAESRKQDKRLLDDITTRLHKLEYDNVKPSGAVKIATGFRRFIYGHKPPIEKETKEQRRRDELMYPWNYTQENIFRVNKKTKASKKSKAKANEEEEETDRSDQYPQHDPFGVYKTREERKHVSLDDIELPAKKHEGRCTTDMLVTLRAKANSAQTSASVGEDINTFVDELSRAGATRPDPVNVYMPYQSSCVYGPDEKFELDPMIAVKFQQSRAELDEFSRSLDNIFKRRPLAPRPAYIRPKYQPPKPLFDLDDFDVDLEDDYEYRRGSRYDKRELGMGAATVDDAPYLDEPIVTTTTVRPLRALSRTGFIRGSSTPPVRRGNYQYGVVTSRPPPIPTKVTRRQEIEVHTFDYDEDYE